MAEWFTVVDGVRLSWEQVVFKLSTGAWTLAEATKHTLLTSGALQLRLEMTKAAGGAVGRAAASALVRMGLVEAAGVGAAGAMGAGATGAGGIGVLGWLGIAGLIVLVGAGGYYVWTHRNPARPEVVPVGGEFGGGISERPVEPPGSPAGAEGAGASGGDSGDCPEAVMHTTKCPWTPEGYSVGECGPGKCWDGGPQGTLACKQVVTPDHAGRSYTNDIVCAEGYSAQMGCHGIVKACVTL